MTPNPLQPTPSHPFYAKRGGKTDGEWIKAADLKIGDAVLTKDGKWHAITEIVNQDKQAIVYNFEVEENHDYLVGPNGVLGGVGHPAEINQL